MRLKIALRNLMYSQLIIGLFLVYAYFVWFPHSFSLLGGFYKTALMLIFVDIVLGPLLVFIVFKEGKKYLKFDINVLLAIQLAAFLWGAYSLYLKHPAYAVFTVDRFTLTNVSRLFPQEPLVKQLKTTFFFPKMVFAKPPVDTKKRKKLLFDVLLKGMPDIDHRPRYYKPFEQYTDIVLAKSIPPRQLFFNNKRKEKLNAFLKKYGGKTDDYAFFPVSGNNKKDMIWVFDRKTVTPVGMIDSDPWMRLAKLY